MTTSSPDNLDLTLPEILAHVWANKALISAALAIGLLLGFAGTWLLPNTITRKAVISIYPTGVPTDTFAEVQDQLRSLLDRKSFKATTSRDGTLVVSMPYEVAEIAAADGKFIDLAQTVGDFRKRLLTKVSGAFFDFQRRENLGDGDAATFVRFNSFQAGIADGSIEPVRVTVMEVDNRKNTQIALVAGMGVFGVIAGLFASVILGHRPRRSAS